MTDKIKSISFTGFLIDVSKSGITSYQKIYFSFFLSYFNLWIGSL